MIDPEFSPEEIREMLKGIGRSLSRLQAVNLHDKLMPMTYVPEAVAVYEAFDARGILHAFGVNPSVTHKLKNHEAKLRAPVMIAALSWTHTYLRSLEKQSGGRASPPEVGNPDLLTQEIADTHPPEPIQIWTEQWIYVRRGSPAKEIIADVSERLDEAVLLAKATNLDEDQAALTDIERAQLIAILETTLAVLKSPMVEPGLLKKTARVAQEVARKAASTKAEEALGKGLEYVAKRILELIASLL
ncbi:hypothetical protein [Neorhizobium galegae]|uniref:hypothetical protein n=1 Tax=Neorhizobium galegae TaxID=399 RepID=UPI0021022506|nr:hypothetical protein [Neorhizobium galegae]MCQ1834862.1 hypothetical protein [Neorhizobium galegae]UIY29682.1 hypothetical protein LZK73_01860 [Neorhizobium galegae]